MVLTCPPPTHVLTCCSNVSLSCTAVSPRCRCVPFASDCHLLCGKLWFWFHKYLLLLSYLSGPSCAVSHKPHCDLVRRLLLSLNTIMLLPVISRTMYFCVSLDWWSQPSARAILRKRPKCCGQHAASPPLCIGSLQTNVLKTQQSCEAFIRCNQPLWNVWTETLHASRNIDLQQKRSQMNYEKVLTVFPRKERGTARGAPPPSTVGSEWILDVGGTIVGTFAHVSTSQPNGRPQRTTYCCFNHCCSATLRMSLSAMLLMLLLWKWRLLRATIVVCWRIRRQCKSFDKSNLVQKNERVIFIVVFVPCVENMPNQRCQKYLFVQIIWSNAEESREVWQTGSEQSWRSCLHWIFWAFGESVKLFFLFPLFLVIKT